MGELGRPGAELTNRPLHFFWVVDCSGSMYADGKIDIVNNTIQECIPEMAAAADKSTSIFNRCKLAYCKSCSDRGLFMGSTSGKRCNRNG